MRMSVYVQKKGIFFGFLSVFFFTFCTQTQFVVFFYCPLSFCRLYMLSPYASSPNVTASEYLTVTPGTFYPTHTG